MLQRARGLQGHLRRAWLDFMVLGGPDKDFAEGRSPWPPAGSLAQLGKLPGLAI